MAAITLVLVILLQHSAAAARQQVGGVNLQVNAGLDGFCRRNSWIPAYILIENQGPAVEGALDMGLGLESGGVVYRQILDLPENSRKAVRMAARADGFTSEATFWFSSGKNLLAEARATVTCLASPDKLLGVLSEDPSAFLRLSELDPSQGRVFLASLNAPDLPEEAVLLDPLDALFVADFDSGSLTQNQLSAIESWVSSGGVLVVAGGPGWQQTLSGFIPLLPIAPEGDQTIQGLEALEHLSAGAALVEGPVVVTAGAARSGSRVIAEEEGIPILIDRRLGRGRVVFLAADPTLAPLSGWEGLPAVFEPLLIQTLPDPPWSRGFMSGFQAVEALAELPGLELPPISLICGFLGLYILAVGPANYLLLRRLKRRDLAWMTIPVLVLLFSIVAFLIGDRSRGNIPIVNQLSIVQSRAGTPLARVDSLIGVFSPLRGTYTVTMGPGVRPSPIQEDSPLGSAGWMFVDSPEGRSVNHLQVDIGGLRTLAATGQTTGLAMTHDLQLSPEGRRLWLRGRVANGGPLRLEDAVLLGPGGVQQIGDLPPGAETAVVLALDEASPAPAPETGSLPRPVAFDPLEEILGSAYYSSIDDPQMSRRTALLNAIFDSFQTQSTRGSGIYLAGWTEVPPYSVSLDVRHQTSALTLYVVQLDASIEDREGVIILPPAMFEWTAVLPATGSRGSPYDSTVPPLEELQVSYRPWQDFPAARVSELSIRLEGYGSSGPTNFPVYLWDFAEGAWSELPDAAWGVTPVSNPARFVGPQREIRASIRNPDPSNPISLERLDFRLALDP